MNCRNYEKKLLPLQSRPDEPERQYLKFTLADENDNEDAHKYIPIEGVYNLYCFGALDANSALYNFSGKQQVSAHFFDYYEHYTGSFSPKEYLLIGKVLIQQTFNRTIAELKFTCV